MGFIVVADTDIGISRKTNQDSILVKHVKCNLGEILLAIVCDGVGGLENGELASATVVRAFSDWFEDDLPRELESIDMRVIGEKWCLLLKELNAKIFEYGKNINAKLGTTFTGILFVENQYVIGHVGDTRIYHISDSNTLEQMTADQSLVAREVVRGTMTIEEAKKDKRRNMLLQCVGASLRVEPQIINGSLKQGVYMVCSDGFYHHITEEEMCRALNVVCLMDMSTMSRNLRCLIESAKFRKEKDNLSAILIKVNTVSDKSNSRKNIDVVEGEEGDKGNNSKEDVNQKFVGCFSSLKEIMYVHSNEIIEWDEDTTRINGY